MRAIFYNKEVKMYKDVIRRFFKRVTFTGNTTWVVPENVTSISVDCVGAKGWNDANCTAGKGGRIQCNLSVTPQQTLYFTIGTIPTNAPTASYNASDIRLNENALENRIIVAGGGGSGSYSYSYGIFAAAGGEGGSLVGGTGGTALRWGYSSSGGTGGTQTSGGTGGTAATPYSRTFVGGVGTLGLGGNGDAIYGGVAGAGGAGYYGGGGGATSSFADEKTKANAVGGGGGGSSYTDPNLCSGVIHTQGYQNGNGYISFDYEVAETDGYDYYTETTEIKALR